MPIVDFSKATELQPVPPDTYDAILEEWEYNPSSASSGKPYIKMKFVVTSGEHEGRVLFRNRSLQTQSLWALKKDLIRLGISEDRLAGEEDLEDIMPDAIGAPCRLKVAIREYKEDEDSEPRLVNDVRDVLSQYSFK